jgi:hypothetical protein
VSITSVLMTGARLVGTTVAFLVCFAVSYGLFFASGQSSPTSADPSADPQAAAGLAFLAVACLNTAVVGWLILRSRLDGWRLIVAMTFVLWCVQVILPQVETVIFQVHPVFARHMPMGVIPRIVAAGLLHAVLWVPLAVVILGKRKPDLVGSTTSQSGPIAWSPLGWKLAAAVALYVVLYFTFGYYVAWRQPAVRNYYGGTDPGTFWLELGNIMGETPWLPLAQALRGLVWAGVALVVIRTMKGSVLEKALAVGALFSVVMCAGLLLPNPYMPHDVRMIHLVETASSNLIFGTLVGWLFARSPALPETRPGLRPESVASTGARRL